jgi:hypothetical protein
MPNLATLATIRDVSTSLDMTNNSAPLRFQSGYGRAANTSSPETSLKCSEMRGLR